MLLMLVNELKKLTAIQNCRNWRKIPDPDKYITTPENNKLTKENFDERLKQANLESKFILVSSWRRHIWLKTKKN